ADAAVLQWSHQLSLVNGFTRSSGSVMSSHASMESPAFTGEWGSVSAVRASRIERLQWSHQLSLVNGTKGRLSGTLEERVLQWSHQLSLVNGRAPVVHTHAAERLASMESPAFTGEWWVKSDDAAPLHPLQWSHQLSLVNGHLDVLQR